jgi:4-aminobutyrate aminotransferase/(S)-3-amino-2-methylpropionate transaminase
VYAQEGASGLGILLQFARRSRDGWGKDGRWHRRSTCAPSCRDRVRTEILARKQRVIADAKSIYLPIVIDHAHGVAVTDVDGNTFLDWTGGIGCLNVGHTNEAVSAALHAQVDRFLHTDFTMVPYESYIELAERLLARRRSPAQEGRVLQLRRRGRRERDQDREAGDRPTGRDLLRPRLPRPHLMAMSLTSKQHPYKAGSARSLPRCTGLPTRTPTDEIGRSAAAALAGLRGCSAPTSRPSSGRNHLRAGAGRGRLRGASG